MYRIGLPNDSKNKTAVGHLIQKKTTPKSGSSRKKSSPLTHAALFLLSAVDALYFFFTGIQIAL